MVALGAGDAGCCDAEAVEPEVAAVADADGSVVKVPTAVAVKVPVMVGLTTEAKREVPSSPPDPGASTVNGKEAITLHDERKTRDRLYSNCQGD